MEKVRSLPEQRVLLQNVSWETYGRLQSGRGDSRVPRFTYDRGMLEVVSPSAEHERIAYHLSLLVAVVAAEMDIGVDGVGSVTLDREDLERGLEPDACFYVQSREHVRGRQRIDLNVDPPPDLVIEVDITSPSLAKLPIYARLGVPELWLHDGERISIFRLERGGYTGAGESAAIPSLTGEILSGLIGESAGLDSAAWLRLVRERARSPG